MKATLRRWRYDLPDRIGRTMPAPDAADAARQCRKWHQQGKAATIGYFQHESETPDQIAQANIAIIEALRPCTEDWAPDTPRPCLALKLPALHFDETLLRDIAGRAANAGITLAFDAHSLPDASSTLAAIDSLAGTNSRIGCALPARWQRSLSDARNLRDQPVRIRLVKGEWADPEGDVADVTAHFLELVALLAGRKAPIAVASHDAALVHAAFSVLKHSGTPFELEQLRGLPGRTTQMLARERGIPVRFYMPCGPGWWPYALESAVSRPYLPIWLCKDAGRALLRS
ncbi:MAG: proline dehydrogenase [Sphingomonadaceae bacterium]